MYKQYKNAQSLYKKQCKHIEQWPVTFNSNELEKMNCVAYLLLIKPCHVEQ